MRDRSLAALISHGVAGEPFPAAPPPPAPQERSPTASGIWLPPSAR